MKIQKISSGNASNCQPQRHFSGKISKPQHTKKADVPYMSIYILSENTPEAAKIKIKNFAGSAPIDNESW